MAGRKGAARRGVASFLWNPFKHALKFTGNASHKVGSSAGKIVKDTLGAVEGVGNSLAKHTNQALSGNGTRRRRGGKRRSTRRSARRAH